MALFDMVGLAGNLMQGIMGIGQISSGTQLQVDGFQMAAASSRAAGQYNARLEQLNLKRTLDATSRHIGSVTATQRVQAVATGLAPTSRSFLSVMNTTLSQFERQVVDLRVTSRQKQEALVFEAESNAVALENQAKAAEFQGKTAEANATAGLFKSVLGAIL